MLEEKISKRRIILIVFGVLMAIAIYYYLKYFSRVLFTQYFVRVVSSMISSVGFRKGLKYELIVFLCLVMSLFPLVRCVKNFIQAMSAEDFRERFEIGYRSFAAFCAVELAFMFLGIFIVPSKGVSNDISAWLTLLAFVLLAVYSVYKGYFKKEKAFEWVNLLLPPAAIILFLTGGFISPELSVSPVVIILNGLVAAMPVLFVMFFEYACMPLLLRKGTEE